MIWLLHYHIDHLCALIAEHQQEYSKGLERKTYFVFNVWEYHVAMHCLEKKGVPARYFVKYSSIGYTGIIIADRKQPRLQT